MSVYRNFFAPKVRSENDPELELFVKRFFQTQAYLIHCYHPMVILEEELSHNKSQSVKNLLSDYKRVLKVFDCDLMQRMRLAELISHKKDTGG